VVRLHTEASLRRLGVAALDLTQLHCVPPDVLKRGELFGWLRELQAEGKIRAFGASVESMDDALWCVQQDGCASLQIIFNIFRQKPIATLFAEAQARQVALLVRLPLASGLLAGKFTAATRFPANDHRNYNRDGQAFNVGETFAGLPFARGRRAGGRTQAACAGGPDDGGDGAAVVPRFRRGQRHHSRRKESGAGARQRPGLRPGAAPARASRRLAGFYQSEVHPHIRGPY
jgi:aryl-alcohol dehydrogenase-like predicted oxidoreductase